MASLSSSATLSPNNSNTHHELSPAERDGLIFAVLKDNANPARLSPPLTADNMANITDWRRRVCFTGSRGWVRIRPVLAILRELPVNGTLIIHGGCPSGLDKIVDTQARKLGFTVRAFPVTPEEWKKSGPKKYAGPLRNRRMLTETKPTEVHGFIFDPSKSPGTMGTLKIAEDLGLCVVSHYETEYMKQDELE